MNIFYLKPAIAEDACHSAIISSGSYSPNLLSEPNGHDISVLDLMSYLHKLKPGLQPGVKFTFYNCT